MLQKLFFITAFVGLLMTLLTLVGAMLYDVRETERQRQQRLHPNARRYRQRPLMTVLVFPDNNERSMTRCLDSLLASSYQKLQIIVISNVSQIATNKLVKDYQTLHPKKSLRLFSQKKPTSQKEAAIAAYRAYAQGELVMLLDASSTVDKQALANVAAHFSADERVAVLSVNSRINAIFSVAGLFHEFEQLLRYRTKKFSSLTNADYYTAASEALAYRRRTFIETLRSLSMPPNSPKRGKPGSTSLSVQNQQLRIYYASDVVVYHEAVSSFVKLLKQRYALQFGRLQSLIAYRQLFFSHRNSRNKLFTWFRLPLAVCVGAAALVAPILLSYFVYLAVILHEPTLIIVSFLALAGLLLLTIWGDEHFRATQKVGRSLLVPITYGMFFIISFVQLTVILTALVRPRTVLRPQKA